MNKRGGRGASERPTKGARTSASTSASASNVLTADLSSSAIDSAKKVFFAAKPFSHCLLQSVFEDAFLEKVKKELETKAEWQALSNDLYSFHQSDDLKNTKLPNLARMRDVIYSHQFRAFISGVTGIELTEQVDASAARYEKGDTLLCHDDELEGRRVAYIFYLVPRGWAATDGGALELYDVDEAGEARKVVKAIQPLWNACAFFAVTNQSWHRVAEVLSSAPRHSISGWFHGAALPRPSLHPDVLPPLQPLLDSSFQLSSWLNPSYLAPATQKLILRHFVGAGCIELQDFLLPTRYAALLAALKSKKGWQRRGPANRRQYDTADRASSTGALEATLDFLQSTAWVEFMASITSVHAESTRIEARRFGADSYTLMQDGEELASQTVLDALLCVAPENWPEEAGGSTTYTGLTEPLQTTSPKPNALTLVYRAGTKEEPIMRFTKYVSLTAPTCIYDISAMYWETSDHGDREEEAKVPAAAGTKTGKVTTKRAPTTKPSKKPNGKKM